MIAVSPWAACRTTRLSLHLCVISCSISVVNKSAGLEGRARYSVITLYSSSGSHKATNMIVKIQNVIQLAHNFLSILTISSQRSGISTLSLNYKLKMVNPAYKKLGNVRSSITVRLSAKIIYSAYYMSTSVYPAP